MTTLCPDTSRLTALLDGRLTDAEQMELHQHIDTCERCQQTLESLVAGKESWDGIARSLANADMPANPALHDVMDAAKDTSKTFVTPTDFPADLDLPLTFLQPSDVPDSLGRLAHYEVLSAVGRGGMGIVLKALDTSLRRVVAIKVMSPHLAANASARRRFVREAQAAAAVAHEHVVAIHAVADQHEPPFLAMQFIEGKTLQERLDKFGSLSTREVLRIGMQMAAGLAAAHAQGLVHRDIKPANILLENGVERVKLTDFGLARAVDDASVTQSGVIAGTPQYMSPEQARGEVVDHRSDLFSLGCVLYAMCVGHAPFRASTTMGVLKRVCEDAPRPIRDVNPDVPDWLVQFIDKLMAKRPEDRVQTAKEVADFLEQWLAHLQQPNAVPSPQCVVSNTAPVSQIDAPPSTMLPEVRAQLAGPAKLLMAAGILNWVGLWISIPVLAYFSPSPFTSSSPECYLFPLVYGILAIGSAVIIFGAVRMLRGESYRWAMTSTISSMLIGPGYLIGWPAGIWSLAVLTRPEIRRAFRERRAPRQPESPESSVAITDRPPLEKPAFRRRWWKFALIASVIVFCTWRFGPSLVLTARNQGRIFVHLRDFDAKLVLRRDGKIVAEHVQRGPRSTTVWPIPGGERRTVTENARATLDVVPGTYQIEIVPRPERVLDRLSYFHETLLTGHYVPSQPATEMELYVGRGDYVQLTATFKPTDVLEAAGTNTTASALLAGRWSIVSQERAGKPFEHPAWIEFDQNVLRTDKPASQANQAFVHEQRFSLNSSASPMHFDLANGAKGIYRLDGDELTLCIADFGHPRPEVFQTWIGVTHTLTVCRRVKKSASGTAADADGAPITDATNLQGTWLAIAGKRNGEQSLTTEEIGGVRLIFDRDQMRVAMPGRNEDRGTFKLDVSQQPKRIAVTRSEGVNRFGIMDGIYELNGDHLRICMGEPEDKVTEFKSRAGTRILAADFVRQGAVGPISFLSTTGSLVATGTLVIDRDATFQVPFPKPFLEAPVFVFPLERYSGPGQLSVRRSESSFTIEASEMNVDAGHPARLGWLATGKPGPESSDSVATVWADGGDGWSVGVGWSTGETKLVVGPNERFAVAAFQVMLRNNTDQPLTLSLPELPSWDLTMQSQRRLKVRLHEQDKLNIALAPREQKVLGLPKPQLDLTDLELGNWHVSFATPFVKQPLLLELTLVAPRPKWLTPAVEKLQTAEHPHADFQAISWGTALQGLRFGVRLKSDPADAVQHAAETASPASSREPLLRWPSGRAVKLVPEFFLWNTTEADVEISMLNHTSLDWVHRLRKSAGQEVGPHPILTGPKFDERHRLKPGEAIRLGDSTLHIGPLGGTSQANNVRLDPGEYSYASFLNLHRTDLSHINLHLESGEVKLLIEKAETNKPTP